MNLHRTSIKLHLRIVNILKYSICYQYGWLQLYGSSINQVLQQIILGHFIKKLYKIINNLH